jgi:hypothetical protein
MQETAGTRVTRPVGTFCQPGGRGHAKYRMQYNCANPVPDHGGTFLSEKLYPSGIWGCINNTVLAMSRAIATWTPSCLVT